MKTAIARRAAASLEVLEKGLSLIRGMVFPPLLRAIFFLAVVVVVGPTALFATIPIFRFSWLLRGFFQTSSRLRIYGKQIRIQRYLSTTARYLLSHRIACFLLLERKTRKRDGMAFFSDRWHCPSSSSFFGLEGLFAPSKAPPKYFASTRDYNPNLH